MTELMWARETNIRSILHGTNDKRFSFPEDSSFVVTEGIQHVGVVVGVDRNEAGEVVNYHLLHGRRTGLAAAITGIETESKDKHLREEKSNHPAFGNGNQQWVAMARILNPSMQTDFPDLNLPSSTP